MKLAIGLGSSLGDKRATLIRALHKLDRPGFRLLRVSRFYTSPPMKGGTARRPFLNAVAVYECDVDPHEVLGWCRELEQDSGRRRSRYWGDRPLDLDILVAESWTSDDPSLIVPHPGVGNRPFVWYPLREIWPDAPVAWPGHRMPAGMYPVGIYPRRTLLPR